MEGFDKLYTTREVGELLNVGHRAVQGWVREGLIPAIKIGRSYLITHTDLREFIAGRYHLPYDEEDLEAELLDELGDEPEADA